MKPWEQTARVLGALAGEADTGKTPERISEQTGLAMGAVESSLARLMAAGLAMSTGEPLMHLYRLTDDAADPATVATLLFGAGMGASAMTRWIVCILQRAACARIDWTVETTIDHELGNAGAFSLLFRDRRRRSALRRLTEAGVVERRSDVQRSTASDTSPSDDAYRVAPLRPHMVVDIAAVTAPLDGCGFGIDAGPTENATELPDRG